MTLNLATLFEAVAAAVPGRPALVCGDRRLTFAELRPGTTATAEDLRAHCRADLAGYKLPALFVFTPVVRSPSGKADYRWAKRVLTTGPTA
ncbi:AMP-binding enzyme [Actinomadura coerulea]|uniref:AMP-binding enzyme n=1 Tax=Actinomadura coerulea TaxID=46159 RepID=UPI0034414579